MSYYRNSEPTNAHRDVNMLRMTIIEAKGIPNKKSYYCDVYLDSAFYLRTSTKAKLNDLCLWSETLDFSIYSLPVVKNIRVELFKASMNSRKADRFSLVAVVNIPTLEVAGKKPVEKW